MNELNKDVTLSNFISFINTHTPETPVCHEGWAECAVGEFATHLGLASNSRVTAMLERDHFQLYHMLNMGGEVQVVDGEEETFEELTRGFDERIDTYGKLQEWIVEYPVSTVTYAEYYAYYDNDDNDYAGSYSN